MNNRLKLWLAQGLGAIMISVTVVLVLNLAAATVYAQSSGSVATAKLTTVCQMSSTTGAQSCVNPATGLPAPCPTFGSTTPLMTVPIQTSSGSGNGLIITPSLDVGLFTDTAVSSFFFSPGTDTRETGLMVTVTVDGQPAQPEVMAGSPPGATGVVYDQRFQQLTAACFFACNLDLILSSMSAHSFNFFYPQVVQGTHTVNVYATLTNPPNTANAAACVGPGTLTAVQVKTFSQNAP